jgi:hypothetical protein
VPTGYAPDIVPTQARPFGSVGGIDFEHESIRSGIENACAYDLKATGAQVANDLDRFAGSAKYKQIYVLSGRHGQENSALGAPDPEQLALDRTTARETQQRHSGVRITVYDASKPKELQKFIALQKQAAIGSSPDVATVDAICYGRNRMSDPTGGPPVPITGGADAKLASVAASGAAIASGAMMIHGGLNDPNKTVGAVKVVVGGLQSAGGSAYVVGVLADSSRLAKVGSVAGELGGKAVAPLVGYDVYRHMQSHIDGDPRPREEQAAEGLNDGLAVAGVLFSEFALPALALQFGSKAAADLATEHVLPAFIGAVHEAYRGIPYF